MNKDSNRKTKRRPRGGMVENPTLAGKIANVIIYSLVILGAVVSLLPMWHTIMASISDGFKLLSYDGIVLKPIGGATLEGYKLIFRDQSVWIGWKNTIIYVIGSVSVGFILNMIGGYVLSQKSKMRVFFTIMLIIPLLISGGMVPTFIVIQQLGLVGSRWAIILLGCTQAMYMILAATAFKTVPASTVESARIDGAGHFTVMFRIMFPQCKGFLFLTILSTFVSSYNDWLNATIYMAGDKTKWPMQLFVQQMIAANENFLETAQPNYTRNLVQYAVIVIATLPLMIALPFFQEQIEKGALQGGVKG